LIALAQETEACSELVDAQVCVSQDAAQCSALERLVEWHDEEWSSAGVVEADVAAALTDGVPAEAFDVRLERLAGVLGRFLERDAIVAGVGDVFAWLEASGQAGELALDEVLGGSCELGPTYDPNIDTNDDEAARWLLELIDSSKDRLTLVGDRRGAPQLPRRPLPRGLQPRQSPTPKPLPNVLPCCLPGLAPAGSLPTFTPWPDSGPRCCQPLLRTRSLQLRQA
jgi:hypothetical protein